MTRPVSLSLRLFALVLLFSMFSQAQQLQSANWGQQFGTEGANLRFMEIERKPSSDGQTYIHYFLQAIGMPKNVSYSLWEWEVGSEPQQKFTGISLRDDAVLLCSGKPGDCSGATEEQVYVLRLDSMQGEPKRFALVSSDGRAKAFGSETPFPVENAAGNCKVALERKKRDASEITVRGAGFKPNDRVTVAISGETNGTTLRSKTDAQGNFSVDFTHSAAPTTPNGDSQVNVKGSGCETTLPWKWGKDAEKKL